MKIHFIDNPVKSLVITDQNLNSDDQNTYLKILNMVGESEIFFWSKKAVELASINHFKGIRATMSRSRDKLSYKKMEQPGSTLVSDDKAKQNIENYSYQELIKIAGKKQGATFKDAILPGSIYTSPCNPLMACPECNGTGICSECDENGMTNCPICEGSGNCQACDGDGKCPECQGSGICPNCDGDGEVDCSNCDGDGWIYCDNCGGTGTVNCRECDGIGKCQECDGTGEYQLRSGRYVTCKACNGSGKCPTCHGRGVFYCKSCGGDGHVDCDECDGDGTEECHDCYGSGKCRDCHGSGNCRDCHGTGECYKCHGMGEVKCPSCKGSRVCKNCNGKTVVKCVRCNGTGKYQTYTNYEITHTKDSDRDFFCLRLDIDEIEYKNCIKEESVIWNGTFYTVNKGEIADKNIEMLKVVSCAIRGEFQSFIDKNPFIYSNFRTDCSMVIEQIPVTEINYFFEESYHSLYIIGANHLLYYNSWPNFSTRLKHIFKNLF